MASGRQCIRQRRRGFTLVELLVAILILSLALISLGQLYLAGMWTTQKARYMSIATQRARAELERVQDLGILILRNGPSEASYPSSEYSYHTDGRGVDFVEDGLPAGNVGTVSWHTSSSYDTGYQYLLVVNVSISWNGPSKSRTRIVFTTLLTNKQ